MPSRLHDVVGGALHLPAEQVTDDLEFNSSPNWDSLNHISLMLALEDAYGISISDDDVVELTTFRAIREYVARVGGSSDAGAA